MAQFSFNSSGAHRNINAEIIIVFVPEKTILDLEQVCPILQLTFIKR